VTWNALVQDGSYDVHAKRFDADGAAPGGEFRVNTSTFGNQSLPAIAVLSGGDFVVTWNSDGQDGSSAGVYAQRFSAGGTALGAEFQVNEITADTQGYPAVSALSDGGFVVTWQSRLQDGNGYGVYARLYDAGGSAGSEFQVNVTTAFNQEAPVVAALPGGGFVVAWQSENQDLSLYGIYARLYDEFGAELSGEIPVNSYTDSHQFYPAIAALSGGLLLAVPRDRLPGFLTQAVLEGFPHWPLGRVIEEKTIHVRPGNLEDMPAARPDAR